MLWSYNEKCAKINIFHVLSHKQITTELVQGVVTTWKYFKSPFWKISAWYGPNTYRTCWKHHFPSLQAKNQVKFRYLELFLAKKINFGLYFAENRYFQAGHALLRYCDVIPWSIFIILVSMERRDPILYGTKQLYFGRVNLKFTGGGNHPTLGRRVTKKMLRKTRVNPRGVLSTKVYPGTCRWNGSQNQPPGITTLIQCKNGYKHGSYFQIFLNLAHK